MRRLLIAAVASWSLMGSGLYLGSPDRPARFHGLAKIELLGNPPCYAAFRSEDLSSREFVNRWHYVIETDCPLVPFGPETRHQDIRVVGDSQVLSIAGWGTMTCQPLDPELRSWDLSLNGRPTDYPGGYNRTVTLRHIDSNLWELLIEEPATY